ALDGVAGILLFGIGQTYKRAWT
ncbi:MAG: hypothetical protein K0R68_3349, partial [Mycobacterium sp.]|nr:hypothetical protein [Mycobacterium sp.]